MSRYGSAFKRLMGFDENSSKGEIPIHHGKGYMSAWARDEEDQYEARARERAHEDYEDDVERYLPKRGGE